MKMNIKEIKYQIKNKFLMNIIIIIKNIIHIIDNITMNIIIIK